MAFLGVIVVRARATALASASAVRALSEPSVVNPKTDKPNQGYIIANLYRFDTEKGDRLTKMGR